MVTETRLFVAEHVTPGKLRDHYGSEVGRKLRSSLPFEVEVLSTPEPRNGNFDSTCARSEVYRISEYTVGWLKKNGMLLERNEGKPAPVVCACMGRLID